MSGASPPLRCPVCGARFRSSADCPRCGADLRPLMSLAARAQRLRERARRSLLAGRTSRAAEEAAVAQSLMATTAGSRLERLARWLERAG